jgi:hypothetical protein
MPLYHYVVSYESDTQPVHTVRGEIEARDTRQAALRSGREASRRWPKARSFRSVVVVVEKREGARSVTGVTDGGHGSEGIVMFSSTTS